MVKSHRFLSFSEFEQGIIHFFIVPLPKFCELFCFLESYCNDKANMLSL